MKGTQRSAKAAWVAAGLWAALVFALSELPGPAAAPLVWVFGWDKAAHLVEFGVFAWLLAVALSRTWPAASVRHVAAAAFALAAAYGVLDEVHQLVRVELNRVASPLDALADALGAALAATAFALVARRRRGETA